MSSKWAFNTKRPSVDSGQKRRTEGNAESEYITPYINDIYKYLLEFDFTYVQLYEMTISEMIDTLTARRKGLAYRIWKESYLIAWAVMGKGYPKTPEKASPELYPAKPRIKMPPNLLKAQNGKRGGKIIYE